MHDMAVQVAGQQGAYIARIINRNHVHGIGGGDAPYMVVEANKAHQAENTFDFLVRSSACLLQKGVRSLVIEPAVS